MPYGDFGDVRPYLQVATLLVLSSDKDGLPLSIVEAMAMGVACVSTDLGGAREFVLDGKTGLLISPGDRHALTRAVEHLLQHEEERRLMGREGRRLVAERFAAENSMDQYRTLLA